MSLTVPRWQRVTRRATTQGPIRQKRGLTQNSRAGNPKRCDLLTAKAGYDCFINATPLRNAQKPCGGHPWCGRHADLPAGTVGQWPPAPCNGGPNQRAATVEPTMRQRGRLGPQAGIPQRQLPNCHKKRYSRTSMGIAHKGGGPKTPVRVKGKGPKDPGVEAPRACLRRVLALGV